MKKVIVYGTGMYFKKAKMKIEEKYEIIGYLDTFKHGEFEGLKIYSIEEVKTMEFDKIIICSTYFVEIGQKLLDEKIDAEKIDIGLEYSEDFNIKRLENIGAEVRIKEQEILFSCGECVIKLDGQGSVYVVKEIFLNEEYNYSFDSNKEYVVLDIGANIGDTALYFASKESVKSVISFEPFFETYNKAKQNIVRSSKISKKIKLYNFGLGKDDKEINVHFNEEISGCMSSVSDNSKFEGDKLKSATIEIRNFKKILKEIIDGNSKEKIFIKMDCEGAEFEIFDSIKDDISLLKNVEALVMEWHEQYPTEILEILDIAGFKYICNKLTDKVGMIYGFKENI